jgi:monothiol glutaredoxin
VYFKGEFTGGCDILIQMHQNGELVEELASIGHESTFDATHDDE